MELIRIIGDFHSGGPSANSCFIILVICQLNWWIPEEETLKKDPVIVVKPIDKIETKFRKQQLKLLEKMTHILYWNQPSIIPLDSILTRSFCVNESLLCLLVQLTELIVSLVNHYSN